MTVPTQVPIQDARDWKELVPGLAAKIWAQQNAQLTHKRRVETAQVILQFFGPVLGAGVVLVCLFTGVWLIYYGHSTEGALIATIDLIGFFLAMLFAMLFFLRGRRSD